MSYARYEQVVCMLISLVQVRVRPGGGCLDQVLVLVERELPVLEVLIELVRCVAHALSVHVPGNQFVNSTGNT